MTIWAERHADLVWSRFLPGSEEGRQQALAVSAALAVRLVEARPIQRFDLEHRHEQTPTHLLLEVNRFVFLVAGSRRCDPLGAGRTALPLTMTRSWPALSMSSTCVSHDWPRLSAAATGWLR